MSGEYHVPTRLERYFRNTMFGGFAVFFVGLIGATIYGANNPEAGVDLEEPPEPPKVSAELKTSVQAVLDEYNQALPAEQSKLLSDFIKSSPDGEGRIGNEGDVYVIHKDSPTVSMSYTWFPPAKPDYISHLEWVKNRDEAQILSEKIQSDGNIPTFDSQAFEDLVLDNAYDFEFIGFPNVVNESPIIATYNTFSGRVCDMTTVGLGDIEKPDCFSNFEVAAGTELAKQIAQIDKHSQSRLEKMSHGPNGP